LASSGAGVDQLDEVAQRNEIKEAFYIGARDQICVVTSDRDIILYDRKDLGLSKQVRYQGIVVGVYCLNIHSL